MTRRLRANRDLTVLVGENNGGKTTVLDAIRLCTTPSEVRNNRHPTSDDIRRGAVEPIQITAAFADLTVGQQGLFYTALHDHGSDQASFGYEWTQPEPGHRRGATVLRVGLRGTVDAERENRELIRHVHLPALRDAERDLASSSPGRIEFLLRHLSADNPSEQEQLIASAQGAFDDLRNNDPLLSRANSKVQMRMATLHDGFHRHEASLGFSEPSLRGLARELRFRLRARGMEPEDLSMTGLGYANLLYLAAVLVELDASKDYELTLLLVEEPEAHLHPQLQAVVLEMLRDQACRSRMQTRPEAEHAGHIQVIVSSHSPNLAAAVSIEHLVVLRSAEVPDPGAREKTVDDDAVNKDPGGDPPTTEPDPNPAPICSRAIAVNSLEIEAMQLRKIDRYLDVTRSALLFARRVILVEGIAEALLLPMFARHQWGRTSEQWRRFVATTLVPIEGVDFEPYIRLLLTPAKHGETIAERVVVMTDDDPVERDTDASGETVTVDADEGDAIAGEEEGVDSPGIKRSAVLREITRKLGVEGRLAIQVTPVTLEAMLIEHCGDDQDRLTILRDAFCSLLPTNAGRVRRNGIWKVRIEDIPKEERGTAFLRLMESTGTRKGDFAQALAGALQPPPDSDSDPIKVFGVPKTIQDALEEVVA